jgi:TRAP-type C4-dicarboxylate transport system permease small subunit
VLVGVFGAAMAWNGWILGESVMAYKLPNIALSESVRYAPLVVSGVLIVLFSIEHLVALVRREEVVPAWH